ncbi:MAG: hypothetical protein U0736_18520 [Gemmataceae bacterium]
MRIDQYTIRVALRKGLNTLLLKVCQNEQSENWAQDWKFQLRVCDAVGAGVPFTAAKAPRRGDTTRCADTSWDRFVGR